MDDRNDHDAPRADRGEPAPIQRPSALPVAMVVVLAALAVGTFAAFRMRALATPGNPTEIPRKAGPEIDAPAASGETAPAPR
jgi:hypothetical protein